ncbi:MAG: serine/threonine protein kinase [Ktedonobacteraceae bacterium]
MFSFDNQAGGSLPRTMLKQQYVIVGQAYQGGVQSVYRGIDTRNDNRPVAIQEISQADQDATVTVETTRRLQYESSLLASLQHPSLPRIYDAFSEQGCSYLVLDYIEGKTLTQLLHENGERALPINLVLLYARQLCDVLAYLYQHVPPIIFRDIQPSNVLITRDGLLFVVGFRIADASQESIQPEAVVLNSSGSLLPEQRDISHKDLRSVYYGLGAILHYCLTGREPDSTTEGSGFPLLGPHNPQVPLELDQLIQRLVSASAEQQEISALEVQQALMNIHQRAAEFTSVATPTPAPTPGALSIPASNSDTAAVSTTSGQVLTTEHAHRPGVISRLALVWTARFALLSGFLLALILASSLYALNFINGSAHIIEFSLALILLIVSIASGSSIYTYRFIPWSILLCVAIASLLAGLAFLIQATPLAQRLIANFIPVAALNQIVTSALVAAAVASLFWLVRPFTWLDRVVLIVIFGTAAICGIYQSTYRDETVLQSVFSDPRALQYAIHTEAVHKHLLLIIVLVTLMLGVLVATQMERVYERTRKQQA